MIWEAVLYLLAANILLSLPLQLLYFRHSSGIIAAHPHLELVILWAQFLFHPIYIPLKAVFFLLLFAWIRRERTRNGTRVSVLSGVLLALVLMLGICVLVALAVFVSALSAG
jgi:hypothetical protein